MHISKLEIFLEIYFVFIAIREYCYMEGIENIC